MLINWLNKIVTRSLCTMDRGTASKIWATSDIHTDSRENMELIKGWSNSGYLEDCLIVAGDISDNVTVIEDTLSILKQKFKEVFFVVGNHDLWVGRDTGPDKLADSIERLHQLNRLCAKLGVRTSAVDLQTSEGRVILIPLLSWYSMPEDEPDDSLYRPFKDRTETDEHLRLWSDNRLCVWPDLGGKSRSEYFASLNPDPRLIRQAADSSGTEDQVESNRGEDIRSCGRDPNKATVITFSHFLPRQDLIGPTNEEVEAVDHTRRQLGLDPLDNPLGQAGNRAVNFSRYAGCRRLEQQLRAMGAAVHVYGHQHRNRNRVVDGVRYVSHCVGYAPERAKGLMWDMDEACQPALVWPLNCETA